jgi:hypothetical protein
MTYQEFRAAAAGIVTAADLRAASDALAARAAAARLDGRWLIVESHAVAREAFGWRAYPDPPGVLARYRYDILVYLDAATRLPLGVPLNVIDADAPASTVTAAVASVLGLPDR